MVLKLENTINPTESNEYYSTPSALLDDIKVLEKALTSVGSELIVEDLIFPIERQILCFGFHLAKLDIRKQLLSRYSIGTNIGRCWIRKN